MLLLIIVNKAWECDAVLAALLGEGAPPLLREHWPSLQDWPRPRRNPPRGSAPQPPDPAPRPRAVYTFAHTVAEVWCVSDLIEHFPDEPRYQSSSQRKAERLPIVHGGRPIDLVVAVGTGTVPIPSENLNGGVVVGTSVFAHDGDPSNGDSRWACTFDTLVRSTLSRDAFNDITATVGSVLPRLLVTPRAPTTQLGLVAQHDFVSLGDVNVTDYTKYGVADLATVKAFADVRSGHPAMSLETTHAVIRACLGDRFLFVTGVANRYLRFDEDVGGPSFNTAQNFASAFNAGVTIAWLIAGIERRAATGAVF